MRCWNTSIENVKGLEMTPPIYRARRKDSGDYVEGNFIHVPKLMASNELYMIEAYSIDDTGIDALQFDIDPSTLAISFEDMVDSKGIRIFAALNESGVGGDMFKKQYVFVYIRGTLYYIDTTVVGVEVPRSVFRPSDFEVTGIYEVGHQ